MTKGTVHPTPVQIFTLEIIGGNCLVEGIVVNLFQRDFISVTERVWSTSNQYDGVRQCVTAKMCYKPLEDCRVKSEVSIKSYSELSIFFGNR